MSNSTDNRIIQMQFENKQFEKNIAKSQKSLEDFKEEMDFEATSKGMKKFAKSMNGLSFGDLANNLQKLTDKFTGLGDAGEFVVSRIRASLEGAARSVEAFIKSISMDQIAVGQSKYDALNKAVMTITATGKYTEEQAYEIFERLMTYTNETSYSFADMVNQVSAFTAAGQDLVASEQAMEGIANMSAKAGQGVSQATSAMQIFAKSLGSGSLNLQQWQSLNLSAHVITEEFRQTLMDTAVEMGTLTKKADKYYTATKKGKKELVQVSNLESTLNKDWATSAVLMKTLQKYYFQDIDDPTANWETFAGTAAKAAQRALNLADAFNAMKEAVSAGWMTSFRLMFGDLSEAMETFTNIANRAIESLDRISEWRNGILTMWSKFGGRQSLVDVFLGDYGKSVQTGAVGIIDIIDDAGKIVGDAFWDFMRIFAQATDPVWAVDSVWSDPGARQVWLGKKLKEITENVKDFIKGIKNFFTEDIQVGNESKSRLEVIRDVIQGILSILYFGYSIITNVIDFLGNIREQLRPSFDAIYEFLDKLGVSLYNTAEDAEKNKSIKEFFDDLAETFRPLTDGINDVITSFMDLLSVILIDNGDGGKNIIQIFADVLKTVADIISKIGKPVLTFIANIFDALNGLFSGGFTKENISATAAKIGDAFKGLLIGLLDALPESFGFIKTWIYDLFGLWEDDTERNSNSLFSKIHDIFAGGFSGLKTFFTSITSGFNIGTWIKSKLGFSLAIDALNTVSSWFKGTNLYAVIMAFLGVATLGTLWRLLSNVKNLFKNLQWGIGEIAESIKHGFKVRYDDYGEYMFKITEAIGIIVACVVVLGAMPVENLIKGIAALGAVMLALVLFNMYLKKSMSAGSLKDQLGFASNLIALGFVVTALSIGLSILILALTPISKDAGRMLTAVLGLGSILAVLTIFMLILKENDLSSVKIAGIIGFAIGIAILVSALTKMAKLRPEQILAGLLGLGLVMAELAALAYFINREQVNSVKLAGILGLSVGIMILVLALLPLAHLKPEQLVTGLAGIGTLMLELAALANFVSKENVNSVKLAGIMGLAFGITILVLALLPLAHLKPEQLVTGLAGIGVIMLELAGLANFISKENVSSVKLAGVMGLALSIGILVMALIPLAQLSLGQLALGVGGLAAIFGEILGFAYLVNKLKIDSVKIGGLALLVVCVTLLANTLIPLAQLSLGQMAVAIMGLTAVMILLGVFVTGMSGLKADVKSSIAVLVMMAGLVIVIKSFTKAIDTVKNVKWEVIAAFAVGLSIMLIAMAGAIKILSSVSIKGAAVGILAMVVGLAAVLTVLAYFIPLIISMSTSALADASGKLVLVGEMISKFSNTMSSVDGGGIDKAIDVFDKIKIMFGRLVGFKSGDISGFTTAMFDLGASLSMFNDYTKNITSPEGSAWVTTLGYLITLDPLLKDIDFYDAALNMAYLGAGIEMFNEGAGDTPNAASYSFLSDLAGMSGDLDTISKMDIDGFKTKIAGLGGAIAIYAMGVKEADGIELGTMPDVSGAIAVMKSLSGALVGEGGFQIPTDFPSEGELTNFGTELAALALALQKFADASSGFGNGTDKALEAVGFLASLKEKLTVENLIVTKVFDGISLFDLGAFGLEITALGNGLTNFAKSCEGFPDTKEPFKALEFLVGLKDYLTAQKIEVAVFNFFTGNNITTDQLTEFGKQIGELGKAMRTFATETSSVNADTGELQPLDFSTAISALDSFVEIKDKLPLMDGLDQIIHGHVQSFTDLGGEIVALGTALKTFAGDITGENGGSIFDEDAVNTAITVTDDMVKLLKRIQKKFDKVDGVSQEIDAFINGRQVTLTDVGKDIGGFGEEIGGLATGVAEFKDIKTDEVERVLGIVQSCIDLLRKLRTKVTSMNTASSKWSVSWGEREFNLSDIGAQVGDFGDGIGQLAVGLAKFQPKEGGAEITKEAVTNVSGIIEQAVYWLADLNAWLPLLSGGTDMFVKNAALFGTISLSDVGTQIGEFGEGLSSFGTGLSKFTAIGETEVTTAIGAVQSAYDLVFGLATQLPTVDGIKNIWDNFWYGRETQLKDIGTQIGLLGEGLGTFGSNVAGKFTNVTEITNAMNVFSSVIDLMSGLAYQVALKSDDNWLFQIGDYEAIARGINTFLRELSRMTQDDLDYSIFVTIFDIMKYISSSMKSMEGEIDSGSIDVFGKMVDALTGLSGINSKVDFSYVGYHIDTGVAKGIRDNKSLVINAAVEMAVAAYVAAKAGLEENSPSKVMMGVGEFAAKGLANGLTEGTDLVSNAGETLASSAVAEAIATLSRIGEEAQPTITPTIDFSQAEADMANYNKTKRGLVLNTSAAAGAASRVVRGVENTSGSGNQNGVDLSGVYNRITELGNKISDLGKQIGNMRIVLNTGVLAGAVTDDVDSNIGRKMFYTGRRN